MPRLSHRAAVIPPSPIRKLVPHADEAKRRGIHVHHLNIGQPDIETPRPMLEAFHRYDERVLAYGASTGLLALRQAVAAHYTRHGLPLETEHVHVTVGGSEALSFALAAVADPGDDVLVFEPFYANYAGFSAMLGIGVRAVTAAAEDGYHLPCDADIEAAIGPRTRALIVLSPGNPTGTIYSAEEMARLGRIAERHDLFIISDEVYREFAYDGTVVTSALSLAGADERVIVVDSISKRFSACGARVGFAITRSPGLGNAFLRMGFARLCPATVDQLAALEGYRLPPSYFDPIVVEYQRRRDTLVEGLSAIPGVEVRRPEGAFYTMVTLPVADADHFAKWLLTDFSSGGETVMVAPGSGFYATPGRGAAEVRIAYVLNEAAIRRSVTLLAEALSVYRGP